MKDIITELQDMRYLNWTKSRKSSGTAGSFLKAYDDSGAVKKYYKLSDYDRMQGIIGHECINEIIVQRLLRILKIEHLEYRLIHALIVVDDKEVETYLCESDDFKNPSESKMSFEDYYDLKKKEGQSPLEFCKEQGWADYIYKMLIIDYLVLNRDRHGANIEVLRSVKDKSVCLAPLFDHGLSLVCKCRNLEELKKFNVMEDKRVQAFIGSGSTLENLKLVPNEVKALLPRLSESDRDTIFEGLDGIMDKEYQDKIWEMTWKRWCSLDSI